MDRLTLQELFDTQSEFSPKEIGVLVDTQKVWEKYSEEYLQATWSPAYHRDMKAVADKYGIQYKIPSHMGNLTGVEGVGSTTTLH